jgi:arylsulfatase
VGTPGGQEHDPVDLPLPQIRRAGGPLLGRSAGQIRRRYLSSQASTSGRHIVGVEFVRERTGEHHETHGTAKLHVDDRVVESGSIRTQARFTLCGEGLCIGYDNGDAVSSLYKPQFPFTGGTLHKVIFDVAEDAYVDLEQHLAAAIARD